MPPEISFLWEHANRHMGDTSDRERPYDLAVADASNEYQKKFGQKPPDELLGEYSKYKKAFQNAILLSHPANQIMGSPTAAGIPKDERELTLSALSALLGQSRPRQAEGLAGRTVESYVQGLSDVARPFMTATDKSATRDEDELFRRQVESVREGADPIVDPAAAWYSPQRLAPGLARMAPSLQIATGIGNLGGNIAEGGAPLAGGLIGRVGSAASFSPGVAEESYFGNVESLGPNRAAALAVQNALLNTAIFSFTPTPLQGKIASNPAFKTALDSIVMNSTHTLQTVAKADLGQTVLTQANKIAAGKSDLQDAIPELASAAERIIKSAPVLILASSPHIAGEVVAKARDGILSRRAAKEAGITTDTNEQQRAEILKTAQQMQEAANKPVEEKPAEQTPNEQKAATSQTKQWTPPTSDEIPQEPPATPQPSAQGEQANVPQNQEASPQEPPRTEDASDIAARPGIQSDGRNSNEGGKQPEPQETQQQQAGQKEAIGSQQDSNGVLNRTPPQATPEITSIKNRIVDELRSQQGAEPLTSDSPQSFKQWIDEAGAKMTADPELARNLVERINSDPKKPISEVDHAVLNIRYRQLQNQFTEAAKAQAEAFDSGNEQAQTTTRTTVNQLAQQIQDTETAVRASGTAAGRALVSRKIELLEDNSLAGLTYRARAAQDGKPLSDEQQVTFTKLAEEYQQKEAAWKEQLDTQAKNIQQLQDEKLQADIDRQIADRRRETIQQRSVRLVDNARNLGISPEGLQKAAEERAAQISDSNTAYNAGYEAAVKATGMTARQLADFTGDYSKIPGFDIAAERIAKEYPDLGLQAGSDTAAQEQSYSQQVWDIATGRRRPTPKWWDVLDDVAGELGDKINPDADVPFGLESEPANTPAKKTSQPSGEPKKGQTNTTTIPPTKRAAARDRIAQATEKFLKTFEGGVFGELKKGDLGSIGNINPERFAAAVEMVKAYVDLGVSTLSEFLAGIRERLGDRLEESRPVFERAWEAERTAGNVPNPLNDPRDNAEIGRLARKLTKWTVEAGIEDREKVVDAVHEELKRILPDITRRQAQDAISGYGEFKELSKDEISVKVRSIKGELQQLAKLEDMAGGQAPKKTGIERREPTAEERNLIAQVNEAKKRGGFTVTDPEKQLKTALDSAKTAVRNRLADMQKEIDSKEKIVKERTTLTPDAELTDLRKQRDELRKIHDEIFPRENKPQTDAQRAAAISRALDKAISQMEAENKAGKIGRKILSKKPDTPENEAKRARLEALRAQREELRKNDPQYQADEQARQLAAYKRNLTNRLADMQEKLQQGNFAKKPIKKTVLDKEAQQKKYELEKVNDKIKTEIERLRHANRTPVEKWADRIAKFRVAGVLSYPTVLVKLAGAAAARFVVNPVEEVVGGTLSKIPGLRKIAAKAPSEGGMNLTSHVHGISEAIKNGMADFSDDITTGKTKLDLVYGRPHIDTPAKGWKGVPDRIMDFFGHVHAALKSPVKRMVWQQQFEKRMQWYARQTDPQSGQPIDVSDPMVQMRIGEEAYEAASRAIFMQDNALAKKISQAFKPRIDPATGHYTLGQKTLGVLGKVIFPIAKVPYNIVGETLTYALGTVSGGAKILGKLKSAGWDFNKMTESLSPEDADLIMRHLKKGFIGSAFLLAGYLAPGSVGGYYQQSRKRDPDEPKYGSIRVGVAEIPKLLLHNPLLETVQVGATMRHVADSYAKKHDTEPQGLKAGAWAALLGLVKETPLMREIIDVGKIAEEGGLEALQDYAKGIVVPGLVQQAAELSDRDSRGLLAGKRVERKPTGIIQHIETGIPGLRQTVPKEDFSKRIEHKPIREAIRLYRDAPTEDREPAKDRMILKYAQAKARHKANDPEYMGENWDKIQSAWNEIRDDVGNVTDTKVKLLKKRQATANKAKKKGS